MNLDSTDELRRYLVARAAGAPTHMAVMYRAMVHLMDQHLIVLPSKRRGPRVEFRIDGKGYRTRKPREARAGLGLAGR